jgi:hypothetical protein
MNLSRVKLLCPFHLPCNATAVHAFDLGFPFVVTSILVRQGSQASLRPLNGLIDAAYAVARGFFSL